MIVRSRPVTCNGSYIPARGRLTCYYPARLPLESCRSVGRANRTGQVGSVFILRTAADRTIWLLLAVRFGPITRHVAVMEPERISAGSKSRLNPVVYGHRPSCRFETARDKMYPVLSTRISLRSRRAPASREHFVNATCPSVDVVVRKLQLSGITKIVGSRKSLRGYGNLSPAVLS